MNNRCKVQSKYRHKEIKSANDVVGQNIRCAKFQRVYVRAIFRDTVVIQRACAVSNGHEYESLRLWCQLLEVSP